MDVTKHAFSVFMLLLYPFWCFWSTKKCSPKSSTFLVETTSLMVNTEKGNHMITAIILGWIKSLFQPRRYQDSVECYVASKHPTTTAEVEYWIREYDTRRHDWAL